jgi:hypothetical protein
MRAFKVAWFVVLVAASFSSAQPQSQAGSQETAAKQSKALVYVYRYKQFVGSALAPSVYCDEVQLARMENGRYFAVTTDPGKHIFRSNDTQSGIDLDVKAGQTYFIRVEIATGMMKGHGRLLLTSPEQGRYELQSSKLKPLDSSKVADQAHVSVEEAKLDTVPAAPAAVAPQAPPPAKIQPVSDEHPVTGTTLSDGSQESGGQVSLGDAARQARKSKSAQDTGNNATPVPH